MARRRFLGILGNRDKGPIIDSVNFESTSGTRTSTEWAMLDQSVSLSNWFLMKFDDSILKSKWLDEIKHQFLQDCNDGKIMFNDTLKPPTMDNVEDIIGLMIK